MILIKEAVFLWFNAVFFPKKTIIRIKSNNNMLMISSLSILIYAFLYSITAFLLYLGKIEISIKPWMPIDENVYYLYQTFFTIPWGFCTWAMLSGIAHLLSLVGKKDENQGSFEKSLLVNAIAWILPSFYLTWTPETILAILTNLKIITPEFKFPVIFEMFRLMIFLPLWQVILTGIGLRETHKISWIKAFVIGIITTGLSFIMFLAFLR